MKREKEIPAWEALSPDDRMKYEIAEELGLLEKVRASGWKSLSAKETGRIGGLMTKKKRILAKAEEAFDKEESGAEKRKRILAKAEAGGAIGTEEVQ